MNNMVVQKRRDIGQTFLKLEHSKVGRFFAPVPTTGNN